MTTSPDRIIYFLKRQITCHYTIDKETIAGSPVLCRAEIIDPGRDGHLVVGVALCVDAGDITRLCVV